MNRRPNLLRTALAIVAGVLFALAAAGPAAAAPVPFTTGDTGENLCTVYSTTGEADWPDIVIQPEVDIVGTASTTILDDRPCLGVENRPRLLQFTAYSGGLAVDSHTEGLSNEASKFEYAFALTADETDPIEYVTVAVCIDEIVIGQPECTKAVVVYPAA